MLAAVLGVGPACEKRAAKPLPSASSPPAVAQGLEGAVQATFTLERDLAARDAFWQLPFPSELRRDASGRIVWSDAPGYGSLVLGRGIREAEEVSGFSVAPVVYFHFTGPIDVSGLPTPEASRAAGARVVLVDVDAASPRRGERIPISHRWYPKDLAYVPANTLAVQPVPGFVLRPGTLYAAVVTRALGAGAPLGTSRDLERVKARSQHADVAAERARALHAPALAELERAGVAREDVASIALFRTLVPEASLAALLDGIDALPAAAKPRLLSASWMRHEPGYSVLRGYYCTPNFQTDVDRAPYFDGGGTLVRDPSGQPRPVPVPAGAKYRTTECGDLLRARFVISVPSGPVPASGWPLVISAHGTTGSATSFLGMDDLASWGAKKGVAVASTDQPLHGGADPLGARPGSREEPTYRIFGVPIALPVGGRGSELLFYNALRPAAIAGNLHQAAADAALLLRLLAATDFATAKGADGRALVASPGHPLPRFDASRLGLAGHSQGSQSVAILGAVDPLVRGVLLSGAGGNARVGAMRRKDIPVREQLEKLLGLDAGELDEFHPLLAAAQTLVDSVDPQSYGRLYTELLPGRQPRSVLLFEGLSDSMNVPETSEALATSLGATPLLPLLRPVPGLSLRGITATPFARGNAHGGKATLALVQLAPTKGEDGHFVMYFERAGAELAQDFFGAIAGGGGPPRIGPLSGP